jgi:hypothetical protein
MLFLPKMQGMPWRKQAFSGPRPRAQKNTLGSRLQRKNVKTGKAVLFAVKGFL